MGVCELIRVNALPPRDSSVGVIVTTLINAEQQTFDIGKIFQVLQSANIVAPRQTLFHKVSEHFLLKT